MLHKIISKSCVACGTPNNLLELQNVSLQFLKCKWWETTVCTDYFCSVYCILNVICCRMLSFGGDVREYFLLNCSESSPACCPLLLLGCPFAAGLMCSEQQCVLGVYFVAVCPCTFEPEGPRKLRKSTVFLLTICSICLLCFMFLGGFFSPNSYTFLK